MQQFLSHGMSCDGSPPYSNEQRLHLCCSVLCTLITFGLYFMLLTVVNGWDIESSSLLLFILRCRNPFRVDAFNGRTFSRKTNLRAVEFWRMGAYHTLFRSHPDSPDIQGLTRTSLPVTLGSAHSAGIPSLVNPEPKFFLDLLRVDIVIPACYTQ